MTGEDVLDLGNDDVISDPLNVFSRYAGLEVTKVTYGSATLLKPSPVLFRIETEKGILTMLRAKEIQNFGSMQTLAVAHLRHVFPTELSRHWTQLWPLLIAGATADEHFQDEPELRRNAFESVLESYLVECVPLPERLAIMQDSPFIREDRLHVSTSHFRTWIARTHEEYLTPPEFSTLMTEYGATTMRVSVGIYAARTFRTYWVLPQTPLTQAIVAYLRSDPDQEPT